MVSTWLNEAYSNVYHIKKAQPMFTIRPFDPADTDAVIAIWQACGLTRPWNNPQQDITRKMRVQPDLFLVGLSAGTPIATAMFGYDGHRGWLYYFAVLPDYQNNGYGSRLLARGEEALAALGCPKINLQIRHDNTDAISFYQASGFTEDAVISFGKRYIDDE
ncbi:MAG: GNAT family acetyltransferase [Candidatus Puniceispirillales bacterium]